MGAVSSKFSSYLVAEGNPMSMWGRLSLHGWECGSFAWCLCCYVSFSVARLSLFISLGYIIIEPHHPKTCLWGFLTR